MCRLAAPLPYDRMRAVEGHNKIFGEAIMSSPVLSLAFLPAALLLPLVLLLFVASGCAALIYEVVWYQMLQLAIGASAISLGILLATFMGGLCLGSWFLPRLAGPNTHTLRVYALIEQ